MLTRLALIASAVLAFAGLIVALGVSAERLGDWTDANPERALLAWSIWNLSVLVLAGALVMALRRFRRSGKPQARYAQSNKEP